MSRQNHHHHIYVITRPPQATHCSPPMTQSWWPSIAVAEVGFRLGMAGNYRAMERLVATAERLGRVDVQLYHSLLRSYCNGDMLPGVRPVLMLARRQGLDKDQRMYALVVKAFASRGRVDDVLQLEGEMRVRGCGCGWVWACGCGCVGMCVCVGGGGSEWVCWGASGVVGERGLSNLMWFGIGKMCFGMGEWVKHCKLLVAVISVCMVQHGRKCSTTVTQDPHQRQDVHTHPQRLRREQAP